MKVKELIFEKKKALEYASEMQIEADKMAFEIIKMSHEIHELSLFQSHCNFNLFWVYSISPEVVLHLETIEFLNKNRDKFKRKLTIKEMIQYDSIINYNKPKTFEEFLNKLKS